MIIDKEIKILENYIPNFKDMIAGEKKSYINILQALKDGNFNASILNSNILADQNFLYVAISLNSQHLQRFTCKIDNEYKSLSLIDSGKIIPFKYFSDELLNKTSFVDSLITVKPELYQYLPVSQMEDYNVLKIYLNSGIANWDVVPEQYKIKEYAILTIRHNIYNLPSVMNKFPELKRERQLWDAIAGFYNKETEYPRDDLEGDPYNTPLDLLLLISNVLMEETDDDLLKKINDLAEKNINITPKMLIALSYSEYFKKYLKNVDIESLNENENQLSLLRQKVLQFKLEDNSTKNNESKLEGSRKKVKI